MTKVILVDPQELGPRLPHLFTLKAKTYWKSKGCEVEVRGPGPLEPFEGECPDLVQITTPLFSWHMDSSIATVRAWAATDAEVQVGGVVASNNPKPFEELGVKVTRGLWWDIEACRPACEDYPDMPTSRFFATHGCNGCPLGLMIDPNVGDFACLVPRFEGRTLMEVPDWPTHACPKHGKLLELMDNAVNMAPPEVLWRIRENITYPCNLSSGVEANTFNDRAGEILAPVPFRPWRTAFDETREERGFLRTIEILKANGVAPERVHVYVLYGHQDNLDDAMHRVKTVFEVGAWPFAMRYVPLNWRGDKHGYLPPNWERADYINFGRWVNLQKRMISTRGRPNLDRLWSFERFKSENYGHGT